MNTLNRHTVKINSLDTLQLYTAGHLAYIICYIVCIVTILLLIGQFAIGQRSIHTLDVANNLQIVKYRMAESVHTVNGTVTCSNLQHQRPHLTQTQRIIVVISAFFKGILLPVVL